MVFRFDVLVRLVENTGPKGILKLPLFSLTHHVGCSVVPMVFFSVTEKLHAGSISNGFWAINHASDVECRPIANILHLDNWGLMANPIQIGFISRFDRNALRARNDDEHRTCSIVARLEELRSCYLTLFPRLDYLRSRLIGLPCSCTGGDSCANGTESSKRQSPIHH